MLNWLRKRLGQGACTLCRRSVKEVDWLVAGLAGAVCDRCLVSSVVLLDDGPARVVSGAIAGRAQRMTPRQRKAAARGLVALASSGRTFDEAVDTLVAEDDGPACYPLFRSSDRARWRGEDWINFVWASSAVGDFEAALRLEPDIPPSIFLDPDLAHLMRANLVWARCHSARTSSRDDLLSFVNQMSEAAAHWHERASTVTRAEIATRHEGFSYTTAAKCHVLLDQLDVAIGSLEAAAAAYRGASPLAALLWGDVLAAQGDLLGARAKWAVAASSRQAKLRGFLAREIALRDLGEASRSDGEHEHSKR